MKYVKKWMVVPYQESKQPSNEEKVQKILNNKGISSDVKIKLINQLKNSAQKVDAKQTDSNEKNEVFKPKETDELQTTEITEQIPPLEKTALEETFFDAQDQTFEHGYDYLNPAASTRSQNIQDKSFLDLQKQENNTRKRKQKTEENRQILTAKRTKTQGPTLPPSKTTTENIPELPPSPIKNKSKQSVIKPIPKQTANKQPEKIALKLTPNTPTILKSKKQPVISNNTHQTPNFQIQNSNLNWTTYRKTPITSRTQVPRWKTK